MLGQNNKKVLITGGAGFFGSVLKEYLVKKGYHCVIYDLLEDDSDLPNLTKIVGDVRNKEQLEKCFAEQGPFECVYHLAAQLAHEVSSKKFLWESNVDGTKNLADVCVKFGVKKIVFTSSNCLWGQPFERPVLENDQPNPIEVYGKSKWEGEKILIDYKDKIHSSIIRCPTIISAGRLGLLAILFEFIEENRNLYVVGKGDNKYQFIYADDLAAACLSASKDMSTEVYNIGSDNVQSLRDVYQYVINQAKSKSKIKRLPKKLTILILKLAHKLGISPLGPYHYKMIAESFVFDINKIKQALNWEPTKTNSQMLFEAYKYYQEHKLDIKFNHNKNSSAHKHGAKMGIIRLIKWFS